jgi:hypothetical protein
MRRWTHEPATNRQLKKSEAPKIVTDEKTTPDRDTSTPRIRCPKCGWQPDRSSRWFCVSGPGPEPPFESCGTAWNTFDTGGRCPGCSHQWQWTTCLHCHEWSPHLEWYEDGEGEH